jgi:hypothetical protein
VALEVRQRPDERQGLIARPPEHLEHRDAALDLQDALQELQDHFGEIGRAEAAVSPMAHRHCGEADEIGEFILDEAAICSGLNLTKNWLWSEFNKRLE